MDIPCRYTQPILKFDPTGEVPNVLYNSGRHQPRMFGPNRRPDWSSDLARSGCQLVERARSVLSL